MLPSLISVEPLSKYQLQLRFDDDTVGKIDLSNLAGKGVFQAWDDDDLFFRPYINEMGAIAWNDMVDTDVLKAYLAIKKITFDEWKQNALTHASD